MALFKTKLLMQNGQSKRYTPSSSCFGFNIRSLIQHIYRFCNLPASVFFSRFLIVCYFVCLHVCHAAPATCSMLATQDMSVKCHWHQPNCNLSRLECGHHGMMENQRTMVLPLIKSIGYVVLFHLLIL